MHGERVKFCILILPKQEILHAQKVIKVIKGTLSRHTKYPQYDLFNSVVSAAELHDSLLF